MRQKVRQGVLVRYYSRYHVKNIENRGGGGPQQNRFKSSFIMSERGTYDTSVRTVLCMAKIGCILLSHEETALTPHIELVVTREHLEDISDLFRLCPPPSLVGAYYSQLPDARAKFLHNNLI